MSKPVSNKFSGTKGEGAALISQLEARGEKFKKEEVVAITKDHDNKIIWLEKGHLNQKASGFAHILAKHGNDFANQGITAAEIPQYLMYAVKEGTIVSRQRHGTGRPVYEFYYEGKRRRVAVSIGKNGYIVGANPMTTPKGGKS